jgi:hypothetical protein
VAVDHSLERRCLPLGQRWIERDRRQRVCGNGEHAAVRLHPVDRHAVAVPAHRADAGRSPQLEPLGQPGGDGLVALGHAPGLGRLESMQDVADGGRGDAVGRVGVGHRHPAGDQLPRARIQRQAVEQRRQRDPVQPTASDRLGHEPAGLRQLPAGGADAVPRLAVAEAHAHRRQPQAEPPHHGRQHLVAVGDELRAHLDSGAGPCRGRPHAAAHPVAGLQHDRLDPGAPQRVRGRQPGQPGTDNADPHRRLITKRMM